MFITPPNSTPTHVTPKVRYCNNYPAITGNHLTKAMSKKPNYLRGAVGLTEDAGCVNVGEKAEEPMRSLEVKNFLLRRIKFAQVS